MKTQIGIYQAKATLSSILRAVRKNGSVFEITDRGKPIALISPVSEEETLDQRMQELIDSNVISLASQDGPVSAIATRKGALKRFLEDRE